MVSYPHEDVKVPIPFRIVPTTTIPARKSMRGKQCNPGSRALVELMWIRSLVAVSEQVPNNHTPSWEHIEIAVFNYTMPC